MSDLFSSNRNGDTVNVCLCVYVFLSRGFLDVGEIWSRKFYIVR